MEASTRIHVMWGPRRLSRSFPARAGPSHCDTVPETHGAIIERTSSKRSSTSARPTPSMPHASLPSRGRTFLARLAHGRPHLLPPGVIAAGDLMILSTVAASKSSAWKKRYFVLHTNGSLSYYKSGRAGVGTGPKGGVLLDSNFFVGDSLLRSHAFQLSDFVTTVYLAAASAHEQLDWMYKLGVAIRKLGDEGACEWDETTQHEVEVLVRESARMRNSAAGTRGSPVWRASLEDAPETLAAPSRSASRNASERQGSSPHKHFQWVVERLQREERFVEGVVAEDAVAISFDAAPPHPELPPALSGSLGTLRTSQRPSAQDGPGRDLAASFEVVEREDVGSAPRRSQVVAAAAKQVAASATARIVQAAREANAELATRELEASHEAEARALASSMLVSRVLRRAAHEAMAAQLIQARCHSNAVPIVPVDASAGATAASAAVDVAAGASAPADKSASAPSHGIAATAADQSSVPVPAPAPAPMGEGAAAAGSGSADGGDSQRAAVPLDASTSVGVVGDCMAPSEDKPPLLQVKSSSKNVLGWIAAVAQALVPKSPVAPGGRPRAKSLAASRGAKSTSEGVPTSEAAASGAAISEPPVQSSTLEAAELTRSSPPRGGAAKLAARFDADAAKADAEARSDPFSKKFDGGSRLRKGDEGYGQAVAGSQTAARAAKAQAWVETEIEKLISVIQKHSDQPPQDGCLSSISFGALFDVYADSTRAPTLHDARTRAPL